MASAGGDERPLAGVRVAITRPTGTSSGDDPLSTELARIGASVVHIPLVRVTAPDDDRSLRTAAERLAAYDWIIFTSGRAVQALGEMCTAVGSVRSGHSRIAAAGPATAALVERSLGWRVDAIPGEYGGRELAAAMAAVEPLDGRRVLWPRAREARPAPARDLRAAGALVDAPEAYVTRADPDAALRLHRMMQAGELDVVALTSPSAAASLAAAGTVPAGVVIGVIGPSTAAAAREHGIRVHVEAREYTLIGLAGAVTRYLV